MTVLMILFVKLLAKKQREYADDFDKETIEMSDFTVRLSQMPTNKYFDGDENVLKTLLWKQMDEVLYD